MIEDETEIPDREGASEAGHQDIRCTTRKQYSAKGRPTRRGSIAAPCRRESIAESLYYNWSKEFLQAAEKRLAGDRGAGGYWRRGESVSLA